MAIKVLNLETINPVSIAQRMNIKSMSGFQEINKMVGQQIKVSNFAILTCHMDEQVDKKTGEVEPAKDYERYICLDNSGNMYVTSSPTFADDIRSYMDELNEDEQFNTVVVRIDEVPSTNNSGKFFKATVIEVINE